MREYNCPNPDCENKFSDNEAGEIYCPICGTYMGTFIAEPRATLAIKKKVSPIRDSGKASEFGQSKPKLIRTARTNKKPTQSRAAEGESRKKEKAEGVTAPMYPGMGELQPTSDEAGIDSKLLQSSGAKNKYLLVIGIPALIAILCFCTIVSIGSGYYLVSMFQRSGFPSISEPREEPRGPATSAAMPAPLTPRLTPMPSRGPTQTPTRMSSWAPVSSPTSTSALSSTPSPTTITFTCGWVHTDYARIIYSSLSGFSLGDNVRRYADANISGSPDSRSIVLKNSNSEVHNEIYCFQNAEDAEFAFSRHWPQSNASVSEYSTLTTSDIRNKRYEEDGLAVIVLLHYNYVVVVRYKGNSPTTNVLLYASPIAANLMFYLEDN